MVTKLSHPQINGAAVNVLDYGAVGDGVTDDTVAIQAAVDSLSSNGALHFPNVAPNSYKITDTINIPASTVITLYGDNGKRGSKITQATAGKTAFKSLNVPGVSAVNNVVFRDLEIIGQNSGGGWGIELTRMNRGSIVGCTIEGFGFDTNVGGAIYIEDCIVIDLIDNQIGSVYYGIYNEAPTLTSWNGGAVTGNYFSSCKGRAFYAYALSGMSITGNVFESCFSGGILLDTTGGGLDISGNYFEANQTDLSGSEFFDIYLGFSSFVRGVSVTGNYFNGISTHTTDYYPVRVKFAEGVVFEGNRLNTGDKFLKFTTGATVLDCRFGKLGYNVGPFNATDTYNNIPSSFWNASTDNHIEEFMARPVPAGHVVHTNQIPVGLSTFSNTAFAGSGSINQEGLGIYMDTGTTASSTARAFAALGMFRGVGQASVDWSKDFEMEFWVSNIAAGAATGTSWLMISNSTGAADPTTQSCGFRIDVDAIKGITCNGGGTLTVTDLSSSLSAGVLTHFKVIKSVADIQFFINGTLAGTNGSSLPTGTVASYLVIACANAGTSARQRLGVYDAKFRAVQ